MILAHNSKFSDAARLAPFPENGSYQTPYRQNRYGVLFLQLFAYFCRMTETLIGTKWVSMLNNATYTVVDQSERPAALPGLPQNDMITLLCETPTRPHPVNVQPVIPQQIVTIRVGYLPELFRKYRDPQPLETDPA